MSNKNIPAFSLAILLSALVTGPASGSEIYKWVDNEGVIHFSDSLEGIPPSLRDKTKIIPVYEQKEILATASYGEAPRDRTVPNEEAIDRLLRQIWKEYRYCLKRGDIEKALTYIHPHNRDRYREIFKELRDQLPEILKGDLALRKESIEEGMAEYNLLRQEKDGQFSYGVTFSLDSGGNWKIEDG